MSGSAQPAPQALLADHIVLGRPDLHNADVDEDLAGSGACGQTHLPTGRVCSRKHLHRGSCRFDEHVGNIRSVRS